MKRLVIALLMQAVALILWTTPMSSRAVARWFGETMSYPTWLVIFGVQVAIFVVIWCMILSRASK